MVLLFEYYNFGDNTFGNFLGTTWFAQTFTVGAVAHTITSVKLKMFRKGSPSTLTVSIRETDINGHPTGVDKTVGYINANTFTTDEAGLWYEIALTEYTLSAGTKYAIVCRALLGSAGNDVRWRVNSLNPTYDGGCFEYSANSGVSWTTYTAYDFMFAVWGNPFVHYYITGVTRDANGNPLGSCIIWLFKTSDKAYREEKISDVDGNYEFEVTDNATEYFIRTHKDGVPNVFGTTDRNLKGVEA